jgi:lipoprotein Spr
LLAACSGTKPLNSSASHRPARTAPIPVTKQTQAKTEAKKDIKFLDQITSNPQIADALPDAKEKETSPAIMETKPGHTVNTSNFSELQLKYSSLLGTEPDQIETTELLKSVDDWYGTKYKMGGTSKTGIDCSAFVQIVYLTAFGVAVPRTAFEQFKASNRISATAMKEGDLVFFNTTGGVSHVGIYLRNNKFIHASSARGVTVSDLFDPYYLKRFLGVGRIEKPMGTR